MTPSNEPVARWRCGSCANARGALILLLHGHGSDEAEIFGLASLLPAEPVVAALRAPLPHDAGGYRWFAAHGVARPIAASLQAGMDYVERWIDESAGDVEEIWLAGFSGGAMLAAALLLRAPQRYAGAALLHGALPLGAGLPLDEGRLRGVDVFYGTGRDDDVIPAELIGRSRAYLRDVSAAQLVDREYPSAHTLSLGEVRDLGAWFTTHTTPSPLTVMGEHR
jgi:phospholipase/carboxylesterase